jgi:cell division protein FtsQ
MDVDILDSNWVRINVFEKAVAGYVEYLGHYMYFDKDGIVVESSNRIMEGIPFVTGLSYDHIVLHKPLPVKKSSVFLTILNITQLLGKYDIETDRIAFDSDGDITLYFGSARVSLGTDDFIDEKINEMHLLLPQLKGYSGTLHMENYVGEDVNFSFDMDKEEIPEETEAEDGEDTAEEEQTTEGEEEQ